MTNLTKRDRVEAKLKTVNAGHETVKVKEEIQNRQSRRRLDKETRMTGKTEEMHEHRNQERTDKKT